MPLSAPAPCPLGAQVQALSTLLPSCFSWGHHPSRTEVSSRLPRHSYQLFSHPSQASGMQACPHPSQASRAPIPADLGVSSLLQEIGTICVAGGPGCGLRN